MVALVGEFLGLFSPPFSVVAFVLHPFIDRKCRNSHARHAEVVRAIVVSRLGMRIWPDGQSKLLSHRFYGRVKGRAFSAGNFDSCGSPSGGTSSKLRSKAIFAAGVGGWFFKNFDPYRPCSF